ncbi:MAG TPA: type I-C CRISPR-associated protein Cas8c/Csd1 [Clostridiales bacterium]|jgi:CRISPR-associated protein Csd1|nr:type I-C CRISPR-associated protein Cas8c/Csd1 [Clostridiales bacterium]
MILESLVQYYEALAASGKLEQPGFSPVGVSYALELDESGKLLQIIPLKTEQLRGKKTVLRPQSLTVPTPVKRSSGIMPNFLCDNSTYFLGVDNKGKPERSRDCFLASKAFHLEFLEGLDSPAAQAICNFFLAWQPENALEHPLVSEIWDDLAKGANLVFWVNGGYAHQDAKIREVWKRHYDNEQSEYAMQCLVTGQMGPPARLHPSIKGVRGAQAVGASLVSFNAPAFESFGREQGENAPVSRYAAFAYGEALKYLLSDRVQYIGDTAVVAWAEGGGEGYREAFGAMLFGQGDSSVSDSDLTDIIHKLSLGQTVNWDGLPLNPQTRFYILGLAPNAGRLSVRFFLRDSFGTFAENTKKHYDRLEIVRPSYDKYESLWLWNLLNETVNQNAKDKSPSPQMAGDVLRAILTDTLYPATLYNGVQLRIRAEHEVTRGRAAIVKAYLLKNTAKTEAYPSYKEVLTMKLNEESTYLPYVLGRMFSVLEAIQQQANPGINTTIKDKYFNSACSIPGSIFPLLINLAQKHLKKIKSDNVSFYVHLEKQLSALINLIDTEYPAHLSLHDQGIFQLGYYHQTQKRYEKKQEAK